MSKKLSSPSEQQLRSEYSKFGTTISSLAKKYGTSNPTVRKWLKSYGIETKDQRTASAEANNRHRVQKMPSKETLSNLYDEKFYSLKDLQRVFNVGQETVYGWFLHYGIKLRDRAEACAAGKTKFYSGLNESVTEENIRSALILSKNLQLAAKDLNVSRSFMTKKMKEYGITWEGSTRSREEERYYQFCKSISPHEGWKAGDRTLIAPLEIDIVNRELGFGVEYGGLYWHSEDTGSCDKTYHLNKVRMAAEAGIELLTVFESDDFSKVCSIIAHKLGKSNRIHARKCEVVELESNRARKFYDDNHLSGFVGARVHYGLVYDGELVQATSFGKSRFDRTHEWECTRSCPKGGTTVVGGTSRLFKRFYRDHDPKSLVTYADLRFGRGMVYEECGLTFTRVSSPSYWYFKKGDYTRLMSRIMFQKHKLKEMKIYSEDMTEWEIMKANGYDRIWDCGNAVYELLR